jgi:hypothetical protein
VVRSRSQRGQKPATDGHEDTAEVHELCVVTHALHRGTT